MIMNWHKVQHISPRHSDFFWMKTASIYFYNPKNQANMQSVTPDKDKKFLEESQCFKSLSKGSSVSYFWGKTSSPNILENLWISFTFQSFALFSHLRYIMHDAGLERYKPKGRSLYIFQLCGLQASLHSKVP